MKINKQLYIPDRDTYEINQAGQLTSAQKSKLGKMIKSDFEIRRPVDRFIWQSKDGFYNFKKNHVNFHSGTHPFIGQNATFLPGVEYELNLLKTLNQDSIFLSAKVVQSPSNEEIYENMVAALTSRINFSSEDLTCNKSHLFSPAQLKRIRKNVKEYDSDPDIGTLDFVFMGSKTKEQFTEHMAFTDNLSQYFHDSVNVLFFNVRYRIYYDENNFNFLSIEPIEILDIDFYEPDIVIPNYEEQNIFTFAPKRLYTTQKSNRKIGCSFYFLLLSIAAIYIAFVRYSSEINISIFAIGLAVIWFAIVISELILKQRK